jgi:hypothetical protein
MGRGQERKHSARGTKRKTGLILNPIIIETRIPEKPGRVNISLAPPGRAPFFCRKGVDFLWDVVEYYTVW